MLRSLDSEPLRGRTALHAQFRRHASDLPRARAHARTRNLAGACGALARVSVLVLVGVALATTAAANDEHDIWSFSAALEVGLGGHTGKGNVSGTPITGPRANDINPVTDLGPDVVADDASREEVLSILLGATAGIMTPALFESAGAPRLFLDVTVYEPLTREVGLARESDPSSPFRQAEGTGNTGELAVIGRGNKITVQHQGPQVHAGLGVAFELMLWETERVRIKPSVVYSRVPMDVYAVARRPVRLLPVNTSTFEERFRYIVVNDKQREVFHGVGPALEIEYDTQNRVGPFGVSLYLKGHGSYLFGDLKTRFSKANDPGPGFDDEIVNFKYSQDRWIYRAATGIRLRWLPERLR